MGAHCAPGVFGIVSIMGGGAGHTGQAHGPQHPRDWQGVGCLYAAANTPPAVTPECVSPCGLGLIVRGQPLGPPRFAYIKPNSPPTKAEYKTAISDALKRCTPLSFSPELGATIAGVPIILRFDERGLLEARLGESSAFVAAAPLPSSQIPHAQPPITSRPHINKLQSGFPASLIPSPICRLDQRHRGTGAPDVCCNPVSTACGDPFDRDRVLPAVAEVEIGEFLRADVCSRPSQIPSTNATPSWRVGPRQLRPEPTTPKPSS